MTEDEIRAQFEEWAAKQWGNQAYRHTSNCCGEFIAYQAGRKAALLEAAAMLEDCRFEDHWLEPANAVRRMAEGEK